MSMEIESDERKNSGARPPEKEAASYKPKVARPQYGNVRAQGNTPQRTQPPPQAHSARRVPQPRFDDTVQFQRINNDNPNQNKTSQPRPDGMPQGQRPVQHGSNTGDTVQFNRITGNTQQRKVPQPRFDDSVKPRLDDNIKARLDETIKFDSIKVQPNKTPSNLPEQGTETRVVDISALKNNMSPVKIPGQSRGGSASGGSQALGESVDHMKSSVPGQQRNPAERRANAAGYKRNSGRRRDAMQDRMDNEGSSGGDGVSNTLTSIFKAIIYIVFVLVVSGFLSYFGIMVCNDVFAFIKPETEVELTIPEYATTDDIAKILGGNKVIKYPSIFKLYAALRKDSGVYKAGDYVVSPSMNYDMLLSEFKEKKPPRTEVSITIPEGYTVDDIIELFVAKGMGTREGFVEVIQNEDFDYWFVTELDQSMSKDRTYRLEGYLFPDTYYYFSDASEKTIIYKMLDNFNRKFDQSYRDRCTELGYTADQMVTLASMIQAEAKFASEYSAVSSVFHNRLNHPTVTNGKLDSDATVQYTLKEHKSELDSADTKIDNPYNTYIYPGFPPGPICNPSLNALQYALYPSETAYYFFVSLPNGYSKFAETYAEHLENIKIARGG